MPTTLPVSSRIRLALTAYERSRADRLVKRLTVFANLQALIDWYAEAGGYRASIKPAAPALLARWTDEERRAERAEHDLQLQLAVLTDKVELYRRPVPAAPSQFSDDSASWREAMERAQLLHASRSLATAAA